MRFALNKEQWDRFIEHSESISSLPATVGNFIQYFTEQSNYGNFCMSYDHKSKLYGVWMEDMINKFEDKELINALFNMFCYLEEI